MEPITASAARLAGSSLLRLQSDDRLAELAALDNHAAFEALVARYRAPLLRASRKLLPDAAAEDAVQQAFLRAHQALLRNGPPDRFRPWLYKIAVNSALSLVSDRDETLPLDEERVDGVERPDEAYERRESLRTTVGAIGALPDGQRRALVARELEGRSHEEIAAELGLSAGAARQLIHRARAGVRSAATALTPTGVLERLFSAGGTEGTRPVAEVVAGGATGGAAAKLAVATLVAGGIVGGAAVSPLENSDGERQVAAGKTPGGAREAPATAGGAGSGSEGPGGSQGGSSGSGPEGGEVGRRDRDDNEGPGGGGSNEGPGGGDDDGGDAIDGDFESTSSGSGSSGSGTSGSGTSGSGSSGSGSSGSGSSGSGTSGGDTSGTSGSGTSGSDSSGSDSSGSDSSGSDSSGSDSSGSGSGDELIEPDVVD
jgi:RNA polymerase sigma factor (sigma-70 family)